MLICSYFFSWNGKGYSEKILLQSWGNVLSQTQFYYNTLNLNKGKYSRLKWRRGNQKRKKPRPYVVLSFNDDVKNILQDTKENKERQKRKKNVNLFIIFAPFDLLGIEQEINIYMMRFELSKYLSKSFVTNILAINKSRKNQNI